MKKGWLPPHSPYSLLQDSLVPSRWWCLVACVLLNMTTRKQVDRVLPTVMRLWPTPEAMAAEDGEELEEVLKPLGLAHRRTAGLIRLANAYLEGFTEVSDLPGIGAYGAASDRIFYEARVDPEEPKDHALRYVHKWLVRRSQCP